MAIYSEFSHQTWWFSIAMLVYQRVSILIEPKDDGKTFREEFIKTVMGTWINKREGPKQYILMSKSGKGSSEIEFTKSDGGIQFLYCP